MLSVIDIFSSDYSALNLGSSRVKIIDEQADILNSIICGPGPCVDRIREKGLRVDTIDMQHASLNLVEDFSAIKKLSLLLNNIKPDIVHTHNSKGGLIGTYAARKAKMPFIIHQAHGLLYKRFNGTKERITRFVELKYFGNCDLLLFQNKDDLESIRKHRSDLGDKMLFINNGIDFSDFSNSAQRKTPSDEGILKLLCVARMDKNKNHEMIFRALETLQQMIPFEIHLVGDGPLSANYKSRISQSEKLRDRVVFHGFVDRRQISEIASSCHVNLLTSIQEGKPRSAMEAAYMGIPTIATDIDGTREVVIPGITGYLISPGDVTDLARLISKLFFEPDNWKSLSESSRKYAIEHFDERLVIEKLITIYRSIEAGEINRLIENTKNGLCW